MKEYPPVLTQILDEHNPIGSLSTGKGWDNLIIELHLAIIKTDPNYEIHQIKEKFGGLRFYTGAVSKEAQDLINIAEAKSFTICESCGNPGKLNISSSGWWRTRCKTCTPKEGKKTT